MLTKNPISSSISTRRRFATGVPTRITDSPDNRPSSPCQPASSVMNSDAPRPWLRPLTLPASAGGSVNRRTAPPHDRSGVRGRSLGSASGDGFTPSRSRHQASSLASTGPLSHRRCHTA